MADKKNNEENQHKEQPIIIKKVKKGGGHGHHGGAWKVAYADFVTAMMAFFIVMWILGQSEEVKQSVQEYFENPFNYNMFTGERKTNAPVQLNIFEGTSGKDAKGADKSGGEGNKNDKQNNVIINFNSGEKDSVVNKLLDRAIQDSAAAAEKVAEIGNTLEEKFQDLVAKKPEFKEILSSIKIEVTKEGIRIELIETSEALFFDVGSDNLTKDALEILKTISKELGKYPNNIEIEGHTDSRAYVGKNYTNWELSADRANSARRILERNGLWEDQIIKITGFADNNLRNPDNPFDVTNRRISILVKQLSATQFIRNLQEHGAEANEE